MSHDNDFALKNLHKTADVLNYLPKSVQTRAEAGQ